MIDTSSTERCQRGCWTIAAGLGVLSLLLSLVVSHRGFFPALILAILVCVGIGVLLGWLFCKGNVDHSAAKSVTPVAAPAAAAAVSPGQIDASENTSEDQEAQIAAQDVPETISNDTPAETEVRTITFDHDLEVEPAMAVSEALPEPDPVKTPVSDKSAGDSKAGTQPTGLAQARDGGADDLKQIKGVGPKLEQLLHSMGYFHFDQIANWSSSEVAWVDQNLKGFRGRVSRDTWVDQARILAAGGTTAFSSKVKKGNVY